LENKVIEKGSGPNWLFDIDSLTKSMKYVPVVDAVETPIPTVSSPVLTVYFTDSQEPSSETRLISKKVTNQAETPSLDNILTLSNQFKDIFRVTTNSGESSGVEADVLKNKKDEKGIGIRNKARLVAQGHTQEEGIDYDEVFAPIARIEAIRLFLAYASFMGFIVYQRMSRVPSCMENPWGKDGTGKDVDLHLYRSMIGSLMYLTASRPDIMFVVCAYARHQVTPKKCHLHAVKRIFRYLKGHPKLGLWYPKDSPFDLVAYSDSDYGGATQDRKSTTGGCQFLGRRLISWQCKKQKIVATSTTEAEDVGAASCYGQVMWIQN
nr:ribonuclease H-like domain, reverse transcriptase, RNA-dependent DNA polymerase [Tanacetum cinerariifolium]